jgi:2-C-methyl-D-erythritol 4-phosphate cytidylyltransferase
MTNKIVAIVLSGGKGKRMGTTTSKQYLLLNGKPILYYSLKAFDDSDVDEIILVVGEGDESFVEEEIVKKYSIRKVKLIVKGGKERYNSVYNGMCNIEDSNNTYVLVHDGARPFITPSLINKTIEEVLEFNACVVGVPAKDTIKVVDKNNYVKDTPDRSILWQVQTPQAFKYDLLMNSYRKVMEDDRSDITDDSMVVEYTSDIPVKMILGNYNNIKITTPEDLNIGLAILESLEK